MRPSHLRPRDRGNYKESAACPKTKVIVPFFIFLYFFCSLRSQPCSIRDCFSFFDMFSFRPRDRDNYKESSARPITKASNSSHFHIPVMFLSSTFPATQYQRVFSLFLIPFLILEILKTCSA